MKAFCKVMPGPIMIGAKLRWHGLPMTVLHSASESMAASGLRPSLRAIFQSSRRRSRSTKKTFSSSRKAGLWCATVSCGASNTAFTDPNAAIIKDINRFPDTSKKKRPAIGLAGRWCGALHEIHSLSFKIRGWPTHLSACALRPDQSFTLSFNALAMVTLTCLSASFLI